MCPLLLLHGYMARDMRSRFNKLTQYSWRVRQSTYVPLWLRDWCAYTHIS